MVVKRSQPKPEGRLELTWTNKHLRLIDDLDGSYDWVAPSDWRVAEVRLLDDVETVGDVHADHERALDNLLIEGDALAALRALTNLPEFAGHYVGQVKLAYIDPPFNTGQTFTNYEDNIEHSVWLTMLRDRLVQIKKLLRPDGSVWVHLNEDESHRARVVLDEVFGADRYIADVVWKKRFNLPNDRPLASNHDVILVYGSEKAFNLRPRPETHGGYSNPDNDPRGPWAMHPMDANAKGGRHVDHLVYPIRNPVTGEDHYPPEGRNWAYSKEEVERRLQAGLIVFGKTGTSAPKKKVFLDEVRPGLTWPTLWLSDEFEDFPVNNDAEREVQALFGKGLTFDTPKPERLLKRIIEIASEPGEIVLDCFAGSGTTAAVAHKLKRRWVAVDRNSETVSKFAVPRLRQVVDGSDRGGISEDEREEPVGDLPARLQPGEGRNAVRVLRAMREDGRLTHAVAEALRKAGVDADGDQDGAAAVADLVVKAIESELRNVDKSRKTVEVRWSGGGGFRVLRVAPSMFQPGRKAL